jgi:hypothetical protein
VKHGAWLVAALLIAGTPQAAQAAGDYPGTITHTPGLRAYWRLGEASGVVAADATGRSPGSLLGGVALGAHGALSFDADTAARFDGVDDELQANVDTPGPLTLEGWFFWDAGVALLRDSTGAGGWILAYDSGGHVAYRAGGTTFTTPLATTELRDGWHHVALAVNGGVTAFYVDGELVHAGMGAGSVPPAMPWHVLRNGTTTGQYTRGRADEVAIYDTALDADALRAHFLAGRDTTDETAPAAPSGLTASARFGRVELHWAANGESDLDGYDVLRATSPAGPFTRVNPSRLSTTAYTDTAVTGGTTYVYVVTASDTANHRSAGSAQVTATPPSTTDLLRQYAPQLRYEPQESYFADSAAEMTNSFVAGTRSNYLVDGNGTRIAAADPANALPNLSLGFLGDPLYANGRTATTSDYLDEANSYQQDAQRLHAAGYGDHIYGRVATAGGRTWLQYWFFYYYNPQNVLGFGVHEGDWEFAQIGLDADGAPTVATYAQHDSGERCAWSQVMRASNGAPVVFVALASHASYFVSGVTSRGLLPADNHRGGGYTVRPQLEVVTATTPFMAWRGRWGGSSSSPVAPRRHGSWTDPAGFEAGADPCTRAAAAAAATRRTAVPAPRVTVRRAGRELVVRYRFTRQRPASILVSASPPEAPDHAMARRARVTRRAGVLRLGPVAGGPLVVQASAFTRHGARSPVTHARVG